MKLYITKNNNEILRKYYLRKLEKQYEVINLSSEMMLHKCNGYKSNIIQKHILSYFIEKKFLKFHINKKIKSLVYAVESIDEEFILKFKTFLENKKLYFIEINLIDYYSEVDPELYKFFNNIF
jgi:hypothetical protein